MSVRYFFTQSYAVFSGVPDAAMTSSVLADEEVGGEAFRGHIVYRAAGEDLAGLRKALAKLGLE